MKKTGILAALHDEIAPLIADMTGQPGYVCHRIGMRDYHVGLLAGHLCVLVLARIGKVAAAATAVTLIREFAVDEILFAGLAGGLATQARVGDVVIATGLVQHDLDARPLFARYEVPLLGKSIFETSAELEAELVQAVTAFFTRDFAAVVAPATAQRFGIDVPRLHRGLILSGDQFVGAPAHVARLQAAFPQALAVEMEGAAVAQICHEYAVPFAILRTISDRADDTAHHDFGQFLAAVASLYSHGIVRRFLASRLAHTGDGSAAGS